MTRNRWLELLRILVLPVAQELAKTALLLVLMLFSVWGVMEVLRGTSEGEWYERLWRTFASAGMDSNGRPMAQRFIPAAQQSLTWVLGAAVLGGIGSFLLGSLFALRPTSSVLRLPLTLLSAVPAFMFPFLGVPFDPKWLWPAVCLAVGDLNLAALTAHCYEGVRRELKQPYIRTARATGLTVWSDLWPRATLIVLEGIRTRIPHLLGGTVALEMIFDINGIGNMVLEAVLSRRPDYNVLVWVAGLGIIATRILSLAHGILRHLLTPERNRAALWAEESGGTGLLTLWRGATDVHSDSTHHGRKEEWLSAASPAEAAASPGRWSRLTARLRAYGRIAPANRIKMVLAGITLVAGVLLLSLVLWGGSYTMLDAFAPLQSPSWSHPFGTNDEREDVLSKIALGGRQLLLPLGVGLSAAILLGGTLGAISGMCAGTALALAMDLYAELWESVPKLVLVLSALTYMSYEHYALKVFLVIGLAFAPLIYRAVRHEIGALRTSLFLEASLMLGVSRRKIFWTHVVRNHLLPVLCVQGAILCGYVLLFDAILGFCGVRQRSEVFTWGNLLGIGLEDLPKQLAIGDANPWIVWGPFATMVLSIACAVTLGDALKSMGRSVRFSN